MTWVLAGCVASYRTKATDDTGRREPIDGVSITVLRPADGMDSRPRTYEGSGEKTAVALENVLAKRGAVIGKPSTTAKRLIIKPEILMWEDRVTEWSGKSDLLEIRLVVSDAAGKVIDDRTIHAKSKWATFGGDHPQEMLTDLFRSWADQVFEKPTRK